VPVDILGLALLAIGVGCLQFVLERGQADDWFESRAIVACTIAAILAIPAFIWWELRAKHPIIDVRLFKHPAVRSGAGLMLALGAMLYSTIFILPIFVTNILRYTATQTGEIFIPGALLTGLMMPFIGRMLKTVDARFMILFGMVVVEVFLYMMTGYGANTTDRDLFWPLMVRGFGLAFLFVPINTVSLGEFTGPTLGQVAGLMNLSRQIGGSIGIAALSTLLTVSTAKNTALLGANLTPLNPVVYSQFQQTKAAFAGGKFSSDVGEAAAEAAAYKSFEGRLQKQVFCVSFGEIIWMLIIAFGLGLIPLGLMRRSRGPPSAAAIDAH
jgi:DHA2 family multidrug resistance protein